MVTVQTEHLDNHTARLTVDLPQERLEKAVRQAARQIAQQARIPGFRPGKAPFNVIVNMFGYEYVLSQALERIGNEVYQEALEASEVEPYAPGSLEEIEDQGQKLVFLVPKRPEVDLGDYRALRVEYEEPEVTDEMLNDAMEDLREQQAVIDDVDRPARIGDQLVFGHFYVGVLLNEEEIAAREEMLASIEDEDEDDDLDADDIAEADEDGEDGEAEESEDAESGDEAEDADAEEDVEDADDEEEDEDDEPERELFHQHDFTRVLREDDKDMFPGFSQEFVGVQAGDELDFYLDLPEDYDDEELAGRRLRIEAVVEQVQSRHLPEWTDELAARIARDNDEINTILELRVDLRERLEEWVKSQSDSEIAEKALDELVEGATLHYPEELVQEHLDDAMDEMEQRVLAPQGLTVDHYLTLTNQTEDQLREQFRPSAVRRAERSLVLGELVVQEQLSSTEADIDAEIDKLVAQFGGAGGSPQFRAFFDTAEQRFNIGGRLVTDRAFERLVAIAKGEDPPVGVVRDEAEETEESEADETAAETVEGDTSDADESAHAEAPVAEDADEADADEEAAADTTENDDAGEETGEDKQ